MNMKIVIVIALVVLGIGAYMASLDRQMPRETPVVPPLPIPTTAEVTTIPADWQTYTSKQYGFTISYPSDVTHESLEDGERFIKLGPSQSQGTELYDGINIVIKSGTYQQASFKEFVAQTYQETKNDPIISEVSDIRDTEIAGIYGSAYDVSSLGNWTVIFLPAGSGRYVEITDMTVEPTNREQTFRKTTDSILATIVLHN
jgi:hypothetical protein